MSAVRPEPVQPTSIGKDGDDRLAIEWSDGHHGTYTWKHLREACPCATCRGEHGAPPDPFRILSAAELAPKPPLKPLAMTPMGHYAYKISWNDGHDTGIYTLENLRALCECAACQPKRNS
ncbi:MAG: DUF971 domain-containing protein [Gemmataceae bacterium]|nr:DUF971 domain-containing protein [Gemmataceae bacterium]